MATDLLFSNNAQTTIAGSITNIATSVALAPGSGVEFPSPAAGQSFQGTFNDAATGLLYEIVSVTARATDTLTIVRAQENTSALAWNAGDIFGNFMTAGTAQAFIQAGAFGSIVAATGTNRTAAQGDVFGTVRRSNAGALMVDTLPGTGTAVLAANWEATYFNSDASALLAISPAAGANLNGSATGTIVLGPGQQATIGCDGSNYYSLNQPDRTRLGAATAFYVATTGSDTANNGLAVGTPFLTTQHAWNYLFDNYDLNGFVATVTMAAGTFGGAMTASGPIVGQAGPASVVFNGAGSSTIVNVTAGGVSPFYSIGGAFTISNMLIESTGLHGVYCTGFGNIAGGAGLTFGAISGGFYHVFAQQGLISLNSSYTISGGAAAHWGTSGAGANIAVNAGITITTSGTPAFATAFAVANYPSLISCASLTFSGTGATGSRFAASDGGTINTNGGGANYLPGNSGGTGTNYGTTPFGMYI